MAAIGYIGVTERSQERGPVSSQACDEAGPPAAHKAGEVVLPPDATVAVGVRAVLRHCLDHLQANEAATLAGAPEGVHQMRVALRRCLAALYLFRSVLVESWASAAIRADLRWLLHILGEARDWDVFAAGTLAMVDGLEAEFATPVARSTAQARARVADAIGGERYRNLIAGMGLWIGEDAWCRRPGADGTPADRLSAPLADAAVTMLGRAWRRARRAGKSLTALSEEERHDLRKSLKILRYGMEFFAALFPDAPRQAAMARALQDLLGAANDHAVAKVLLARLGASGALPEPGIATADQLWRTFRKATPFWAATVAELREPAAASA